MIVFPVLSCLAFRQDSGYRLPVTPEIAENISTGLRLSDNPGIKSKVVGDYLYEWIDSENARVTVTDAGLVRLAIPRTKRSFDGSRDCNPFLYDEQHVLMQGAELASLTGAGLGIEPGSYSLQVIWAATNDAKKVLSEGWDLLINQETYPGHSAPQEQIFLSKVPVSGRMPGYTEPADLVRASWIPHYLKLPYRVNLPAGKSFGVTRILWDWGKASIDSALRRVNRIQYVYSELDPYPARNKWKNLQSYDHSGNIAEPGWIAANQSADPAMLYISEIAENYGNRIGCPPYYEKSEEALKLLYGRSGARSPEQTSFYVDYFQALYQYDLGHPFSPLYFKPSEARRLITDNAYARSRTRYFPDAYRYRNWLQSGYIDSYNTTPDGSLPYGIIYNLGLKFTVAPDRKVVMNGWTNYEGVNNNALRSGVRYRLHFPGKGDIIRREVISVSYGTMRTLSFWHLLLGNEYVLWHSSDHLLSDIASWRESTFAESGKTESTWDGNGRPPAGKQGRGAAFPSNPHLGETGAFSGAWLAGELGRYTERLEWVPYTYDGKKFTPAPGKNSLAVARYGVPNEGCTASVDIREKWLPIVMHGTGPSGSVLIVQDPLNGWTGRKKLEVLGKTVEVYGNGVQIIPL